MQIPEANLNEQQKPKSGNDTGPLAVINDRYAQAIIAGRPGAYSGLEIHGVRNLGGVDGETCYEVDNACPESFSVYVKCEPDDSGIECVGDFSDRQLAVDYAAELAKEFCWSVWDFTNPTIGLAVH